MADLLAANGPLPEAEARGVGAWLAASLAALHAVDVVHGRVTSDAIRFSPDGEPTLTGIGRSDAPSPASPRVEGETADVIATVIVAVECATGVVIDGAARWTSDDLVVLGCPPALAIDVAAILRDRPHAARAAGILQRHDDRLPLSLGRGVADGRRAPTVAIPSVAIAGLSPVGDDHPGPHLSTAPRPERRGWRRWASAGRG